MKNNFSVAIRQYLKARLLFSEVSSIVPKALYRITYLLRGFKFFVLHIEKKEALENNGWIMLSCLFGSGNGTWFEHLRALLDIFELIMNDENT